MGLAVEYVLVAIQTLGVSSWRIPRIADGSLAPELILLAVLSLVASFRGWGLWPFVLLAVSLVPALPRASTSGDLLTSGMASSAIPWLAMVGLALLIVIGRHRSA